MKLTWKEKIEVTQFGTLLLLLLIYFFNKRSSSDNESLFIALFTVQNALIAWCIRKAKDE